MTLTLSGFLATQSVAQMDPTSAAPKGARITFDALVHDYDTIPFGSNGECSFQYTNTGNEALVISGCRSSCGCVVPKWDQAPLLPGKSSVVSIKYDTRRRGPFRKSVTVESNAVNTPTVVLSIKGFVLPDTTVYPPIQR